MKLTKDLKIDVYEVLADYRVKVENSPFIAILKFAEENGGEITASQLYSELLQPLSEKACKNLLDKLSGMGCFDASENNDESYYESTENYYSYYRLSDFGEKLAQNEEFYDNRFGVLRLFITEDEDEDEFVEQKIVKIEEIKSQGRFEDEQFKDISYAKIDGFENSNELINLETDTYILDNLKNKCRILKQETKQLIFEAKQDYSILMLMDYKVYYSDNIESIRNEILTNAFQTDYNEETQFLDIKFDSEQLQLLRDVPMPIPEFQDTTFNPITVKNVKLSPKTKEDAEEWFAALVCNRINRYFLLDKEFTEFANGIANEFDQYKENLKDSISKEDALLLLDSEKHFYKKAKLETIDYLNY